MNHSTADTDSHTFVARARRRSETNIVWLKRVMPAIKKLEEQHVEHPTFVLLFGGRSAYDFRLRVAQSPFRHDVSPSHWSHAAMIRNADLADLDDAVVLESSLEPGHGFGMPSTYNGLQTRYLRHYDDPRLFPSIAVMRVPVDAGLWSLDSTRTSVSLLEQFAMRRSLLDVPALIIRWLEYVWSVGTAPNPLLEGWGIPSAAVIDALLSAAGYEMCPGLETQATSPEAFWQAARWWHPYYELNRQAPIAGYFHYERDVDYYPGPDDEPDDRALDLEPNSRSMADRKTAKKEAAKMTKKKPVKKASADDPNEGDVNTGRYEAHLEKRKEEAKKERYEDRYEKE